MTKKNYSCDNIYLAEFNHTTIDIFSVFNNKYTNLKAAKNNEFFRCLDSRFWKLVNHTKTKGAIEGKIREETYSCIANMLER